MIAAIHQPNHLPYLGFFDKMKESDIFVIHDDAQFNKHEFQHRNRIRVENGWQYIIVPVYKKERAINQIKIKNRVQIGKRKWSIAHFEIIRSWYKKAPYFSTYEEDLRKIYETEYELLIDLNMDLIRFILSAFDIDKEIVYSSSFGFESHRTHRIIDTVKAVGGDIYLSGPGGRNYLDTALFTDIKLKFQNFKHPFYHQCYSGFVPNMSAIDALFNIGEMPRSD
jgi:hypothetical protein